MLGSQGRTAASCETTATVLVRLFLILAIAGFLVLGLVPTTAHLGLHRHRNVSLSHPTSPRTRTPRVQPVQVAVPPDDLCCAQFTARRLPAQEGQQSRGVVARWTRPGRGPPALLGAQSLAGETANA